MMGCCSKLSSDCWHQGINPLLAAGGQLALMLRANTTLKALDLRVNCIGDDGVLRLVSVLRTTNTTLRAMQLQSNEFGRKGTDALTSLKTQKPMQFTDLSWTDAMPKTLFNFQQMSCPAVPMTEDETARADAALAETETLESAE